MLGLGNSNPQNWLVCWSGQKTSSINNWEIWQKCKCEIIPDGANIGWLMNGSPLTSTNHSTTGNAQALLLTQSIHHPHYYEKCNICRSLLWQTLYSSNLKWTTTMFMHNVCVWPKSRRLYVVWSFQVQRVSRSKKSFRYSTYCTFRQRNFMPWKSIKLTAILPDGIKSKIDTIHYCFQHLFHVRLQLCS